jgi:hypothetical protein
MIALLASSTIYGMHRNIQPATSTTEKGAPIHRAVPEMTAAKIDALRIEAENKINAIETASDEQTLEERMIEAQEAIGRVPAPEHHLQKKFNSSVRKGADTVFKSEVANHSDVLELIVGKDKNGNQLFNKANKPVGILKTLESMVKFSNSKAISFFKYLDPNDPQKTFKYLTYREAREQAPNDSIFKQLNFSGFAQTMADIINAYVHEILQKASRTETNRMLGNTATQSEKQLILNAEKDLGAFYKNLMEKLILPIKGIKPKKREQEVYDQMKVLDKALENFYAVARAKGFTIAELKY